MSRFGNRGLRSNRSRSAAVVPPILNGHPADPGMARSARGASGRSPESPRGRLEFRMPPKEGPSRSLILRSRRRPEFGPRSRRTDIMIGRDGRRRPPLRYWSGAALLVLAMAAVPLREAWALITGGEGNKPLNDPGWPKGAAAIFDHPGRVAWWEGPPFGGGQWHAECRGNAGALNVVLADFARLDAKTKRAVVHDGVGHSFWLNPNRLPAKRDAAGRLGLHGLAARQLGTAPQDARRPQPRRPRRLDQGPPGAGRRLRRGRPPMGRRGGPGRTGSRRSAVGGPRVHGRRRPRDRGEGRRPRDAAPPRRPGPAGRVEPQPKGGYRYPVAAEAVADAQGRWVLKKAPAGWHRVVVEADGYVPPRVVGYTQSDDEPRWSSYNSELARPGPSRAA